MSLIHVLAYIACKHAILLCLYENSIYNSKIVLTKIVTYMILKIMATY